MNTMIKLFFILIAISFLINFCSPKQEKKVVRIYINESRKGSYFIRTKFKEGKKFGNKTVYKICDTNYLQLDIDPSFISKYEVYNCIHENSITENMKISSEISINAEKSFFVFFNPPEKFINDSFYLRSSSYNNLFLDSIKSARLEIARQFQD